MKEDSITVIIPTKNEERTISWIISSVKKYADELIVVDGHSSDKTREIAKELNAKIILDNRKGKGEALRLGISEAHGKAIVFIDADGSHIPEDIPKLVKPILEDKSDLVIASRMMGGSEELHGTIKQLFRLIASAVITLIINFRFGITLTDSQNGFRAIRASVAKSLNLKANKFDIEEEMIMKCLKKGFRITEVPSMELKRKFGKSNINLWKMWHVYAWRVFINLF